MTDSGRGGAIGGYGAGGAARRRALGGQDGARDDRGHDEGPRSVVEAHGVRIPRLGFGTWELTGDDAERMVETALGIGYRHIDTAQAYENEAAVGRAFETSGVAREDVWVTTKVWPDRYAPGDFEDGVRESLDRLRLDAVDLLLLHWPKFDEHELDAVVGRLNRARDEGWARHVGVSNFTTGLLDQAWDATDAPLVADQVEYHVFLDQDAVLDAVREREMSLTAYSPIAQAEVEESDVVRDIGESHGKSAEQVALRWLLQQDAVTAIPRTSDEAHCRENFEVFDFELSDEEMERLGGLDRPDSRIIDPAGLAPDWD